MEHSVLWCDILAYVRTGKMAQWVTVLAAELGGLFNPRDLLGEEEEDLLLEVAF